LEDLDLADAIIVGHSLGGMVLQLLAATHPEMLKERVGALLLVNTSGNPMGSRATRLTGRLLQSHAPDLIAASRFLRTALARAAFPTDVPPERAKIQAEMTPPKRHSRLNFDVDSVPDLLSDNARINLPTTVLASTNDRAIPIGATAALAESIPNARLRLVPGTGHILPLERPDIVIDEIRRLNVRCTSTVAR
ncbi:MAG: alpha/beta fold hydrolase, partial [Acidimicrobiales bacterium]